MGAIQPWHIALLLVAALIIFGSKRLPDAARGLGRSLRIFKSEMKEMQSEGKTEQPPAATPATQALPPAQPTTGPADQQTERRAS
jgi:sec-independent protein translocase protein TatA